MCDCMYVLCTYRCLRRHSSAQHIIRNSLCHISKFNKFLMESLHLFFSLFLYSLYLEQLCLSHTDYEMMSDKRKSGKANGWFIAYVLVKIYRTYLPWFFCAQIASSQENHLWKLCEKNSPCVKVCEESRLKYGFFASFIGKSQKKVLPTCQLGQDVCSNNAR